MEHKDTIGYKLRIVHNQIHKQVEGKRRENAGDLTEMQAFIICFLRKHMQASVYQKDIEAAFSISRATASNMLQVMEREGLLVRIQEEHDARLKKISLTEKAGKMADKAERDVLEIEARLVKGMSEADIRQFRQYLDRVIENIGADRGELSIGCCKGGPEHEKK